MRIILSEKKRVGKNMNELLVQCHRQLINQGEEALSKDTLLSILNLSVSIAQRALTLLEARRTCPGTYWRTWPAVKERMAVHSEGRKRKRRAPPPEDVACTVVKPSFSSGFVGPATPTGGGGGEQICNACGQTFKRDRKQGFFSLE